MFILGLKRLFAYSVTHMFTQCTVSLTLYRTLQDAAVILAMQKEQLSGDP